MHGLVLQHKCCWEHNKAFMIVCDIVERVASVTAACTAVKAAGTAALCVHTHKRIVKELSYTTAILQPQIEAPSRLL